MQWTNLPWPGRVTRNKNCNPRKTSEESSWASPWGASGHCEHTEHSRSKVWWPGIDRHPKKQHRECFECQLVNKHVSPPPIKPTRLPDRAWQEIALDLLGPLPRGEYLLVVVDYFSRWTEVDIICSTTSATIIKCLDNHFALFGVPDGLGTDNIVLILCLRRWRIT